MAPCDGFGNANAGYRYILPMRDNIADSVELMAEAHHFDGMVLLSSCDKSNPGVMMGMARVDRPAIFVGGGIGHDMCPSEILGTAMSMQCLAEALGISLPRTATTYATSPAHRHLSLQAGQQVMELVRRDIKPSDILTREAFENAIRVNMAIGGSYNTFIHLPAIAYNVGVEITAEDLDRLSDSTPYLCHIGPNGPCLLGQLDQVGGIPAVMKVLAPLLHLDVMTVTGRTLRENLAAGRDRLGPAAPSRRAAAAGQPLPADGRPDAAQGQPGSPGGGDPLRRRAARACCASRGRRTSSTPSTTRWPPSRGAITRAGEVLVIRNEGIVGGPGMPEQSCVGWTLDQQGMYDKVYLVTDGRYSGACHGPLVGLVTPEAVKGGPIAVVQTGDVIRIDVTGKRIDVLLSDEEIQRRLATWQPPEPRVKRGFLARYAREVLPALQGGYLP